MAFGSHATNLVSGDTEGFRDIFLADRQTGTIVRVHAPTGVNYQARDSTNRSSPSKPCTTAPTTEKCQELAENDRVLAFLDIMPRAPGHTLVSSPSTTRPMMDAVSAT